MRVLVLGASGFFGRRLFGRLALQPGLELIAACRLLAPAQRLLQGLPAGGLGHAAVVLDIDAPDFPGRLAALAPAVVVHAAGPFQQQDYRVAHACIAAGAHYIDLADARAFVAGIGALDAKARRAGVAVVSGASSVPALSSAAVDKLAAGMRRLDRIEVGISPGNRARRGLATVRAVLAGCGQPIHARQPGPTTGWRGRWAYRYPAPVGHRWLSPCDVPDLNLLPGRYPGDPLVCFGAGLELAWMHRAMNLMAWSAAHGWPRDWARHARWLMRIADLFGRWGSDAGAMHVSVLGLDAAGAPVQRRWELVAEHGCGPHVPTLAAAALIRQWAQGTVVPGARPAVGVLGLGQLLRETRGLAIRTAELTPRTPGFMAELLGPRYARLHPALRAFHALQGRVVLYGEVVTDAPQCRLAALLARMLGTPLQARRGRLRFVLETDAHGATWTREFPDRTMRSRLSADRGGLQERLGPVRLDFAVSVVDSSLQMRLRSMRFWGAAWPRWALPRVVASESGRGQRMYFDIAAGLPLIGRVAAYRGYLDLPDMQARGRGERT